MNRTARRIAEARARRSEPRTIRDPRSMASVYDRYRGQVGAGSIARHVMPSGLTEIVLGVRDEVDAETGIRTYELDEVCVGVRVIVGDGRERRRGPRTKPKHTPRQRGR